MLTHKHYKTKNYIPHPHGVDWQKELPRVIDRYVILGETLEAIAATYGVTRERVRQVLLREGITATIGARRLRTQVKHTQEREAHARVRSAKRAKRAAVLGMTHAEWENYLATYGATNRTPPIRKTPYLYFMHQRKNMVHGHNLEWTITFGDWWRMWQASGHWHERGRHRNQYGMSRIDHNRAYTLDNVHIATSSENILNSYINKPAYLRTAKRRDNRLRKELGL